MTTSADLADAICHADRLDGLLARDGAAAVAEKAEIERVTELLAWTRPDLPWLRERRRAAVLAETARDQHETRVFEALRQHDLPATVMKGASLARTHYPAAWCRPRLDLDLLIDASDRARLFDLLERAGYIRAGRLPGELVNYQDVFELRSRGSLVHAVDVHWEAINRALFVQRLPARVLLQRSRPASWAGGAVRELDPIDSLILVSVHRAAHHPGGDPSLLWRHDVWLLARALDREDVDLFCSRAEAAGVASLCAHDLQDVRAHFGGSDGALADDAIARLARAGAGEPARHYLVAGRTTLGDVVADLRALARWRDRIQLMREHLFPPRAFIAATYGSQSRAVLPLLYAWRIVAGGVRWIWEAARAH